MLYDELKEQINNCKPNLQIINNFWQSSNIDQNLAKLNEISSKEDFWQSSDQANVLKKTQSLKQAKEKYDEIINDFNEISEIIELFKDDENELQKLFIEIKQLQKKLSSFKVTILLNGPQDNSSCFVNINSGAGGTESQDWANMLLRMYLRFCEKEKIAVDIIDYQAGETAGIKSATLYIKGKFAYGLFKAEHGIHRLVRISPFDANKRRHTSFAGVFVTPEVPELEVTIDPKDLRIDTYRASGAGGQHVNKTESAVRITHIPTNTVVQCQNERSQIQNREVAMKMLVSKIAELQREAQEKELNKIEKKKIEWGSQIRSYVLHPYKMVKDHRTDLESPQPELVLDGEIMDFIEKYLLSQSSAQT